MGVWLMIIGAFLFLLGKFIESPEFDKSMDNLRKAWRGEGKYATREKEKQGE